MSRISPAETNRMQRTTNAFRPTTSGFRLLALSLLILHHVGSQNAHKKETRVKPSIVENKDESALDVSSAGHVAPVCPKDQSQSLNLPGTKSLTNCAPHHGHDLSTPKHAPSKFPRDSRGPPFPALLLLLLFLLQHRVRPSLPSALTQSRSQSHRLRFVVPFANDGFDRRSAVGAHQGIARLERGLVLWYQVILLLFRGRRSGGGGARGRREGGEELNLESLVRETRSTEGRGRKGWGKTGTVQMSCSDGRQRGSCRGNNGRGSPLLE